MRSRVWGLGIVAGTAGLAVTITSLLPPLARSLILGSSLGLILVGPMRRLVTLSPKAPEGFSTPEERLMQLVSVRKKKQVVEHERILDNFDSMLSKVEEIDDPSVNRRVTEDFERFVGRLTRHYPEWDSEGRLRTFVLMKKISHSLSVQNADTYLDLAYKTLVARGAEASELSHITLNGSVEKMYRDPGSEKAHHLAGTLLLMNRGDEYYAREMVVEAIHLWSDIRFEEMKGDFAAVRILGANQEKEVLDLLEKEIEKAQMAKDVAAATRARQLLMAVSPETGKLSSSE